MPVLFANARLTIRGEMVAACYQEIAARCRTRERVPFMSSAVR